MVGKQGKDRRAERGKEGRMLGRRVQAKAPPSLVIRSSFGSSARLEPRAVLAAVFVCHVQRKKKEEARKLKKK